MSFAVHFLFLLGVSASACAVNGYGGAVLLLDMFLDLNFTVQRSNQCLRYEAFRGFSSSPSTSVAFFHSARAFCCPSRHFCLNFVTKGNGDVEYNAVDVTLADADHST